MTARSMPHTEHRTGDPCARRLLVAIRGARWSSGAVEFSAVDLDIVEGDPLLITGPNGSGKSTLLSMLAGNSIPSHGLIACHVTTELIDADRLNEPHVNERLASEALRIAATELDAIHLTDVRPLAEQSRGERQLQALAVALASPAELLLLESPTTALDTHGRELCVAAIRYLVAQHKTVVATTVDPELLILLQEAGIVSVSNASLRMVRPPINQIAHLAQEK